MSERRWTHKPPRVAVTGGIGSGKSTALAFLGELGAAVLSSDDVVHRIYTDPAIQDALRRRFGMGVVDGTRVNRAMLGRLVFEDREALDWLEQLTHPHVRRVVEEWALAHEHAPQPPELLAVEVPLLFESGLMIEEFDCVLLITAPRDVRLERVAAKLTPEEFERRATRQPRSLGGARRGGGHVSWLPDARPGFARRASGAGCAPAAAQPGTRRRRAPAARIADPA